MTRIGITGHSRLPAPTARLVASTLRAALRPYHGPDLRGVSCLADGADQIFARAVVDAGGALEVILPAPDYRERKVRPEHLTAFDELLKAAETVRYASTDPSGRETYLAAGLELIARSERIFAVWDGRPSGGTGGTADVVDAARRAGRPVEVIWPAEARRS
jgi:hypothetical protein